MTAPVWMAFPPEVHSAQLSSGPGPAGLLAASAAWSSLSTTYASAADELSATLAATQAGAWEGPTAEQYAAAHAPYLAWLMRASTDSAAAAARHETAATAYTAAVAAMPTVPELAANHTIHGALVATNFFGVNTIPIAVNEADYARMWVQAATTMSTYQAVSTAAVASTPQTGPAPQIVQATDSGQDSDDDGIVDNDGGNPYQLSWWINRFTEIFQTIERDLAEFPTDPADALEDLIQDIFGPAGLIADEFTHLGEALQAFPQLAAIPFIVPGGFAGGIAGLSLMAGIQPAQAPVAAPAALAPAPNAPVVGGAPVVVSAAPATVPAPTSPPTSPAPSPAPASAPATAAPPPPSTGAEGAAYPYIVGGPTVGSGTGTSARAQRKAPEPDSAAAAAAASASAREAQRARRRRRAPMKDRYRGYEFVDLEPDTDSAGDPFDDAGWSVASDRGAGPLGFAGTARKGGADAAGLATLAGDEFGGGPTLPMLPGSWEPD
ncbi:PPE family protein [Mycobacterium paraffinicum]|uniref:PPE family protein n=1 Tax=Mycobacterium paraffinicum TaxID=53378 RepID=A0ABP8RA90_9MYCO|nr:PPE family protein [Mycobacterium paraffinicum]MCV7311618.1 PPE family protein [Mycobacterium paraffinicum]